MEQRKEVKKEGMKGREEGREEEGGKKGGDVKRKGKKDTHGNGHWLFGCAVLEHAT